MLTAVTWETFDHLSVLVAAVVALPTVIAAMLAAMFAWKAIVESREANRQRQISDTILPVARIRRLLREGRLSDAAEQADVIRSLHLAIPLTLPNTESLGASDPLHADPRVLDKVADDALAELRAELLKTKPT